MLWFQPNQLQNWLPAGQEEDVPTQSMADFLSETPPPVGLSIVQPPWLACAEAAFKGQLLR